MEQRHGVRLGDKTIGCDLWVAAGPCSVETREQIFSAAKSVKAAGADALRGGAFKPRTSPYAFHGLGLDALKWLSEAGKANDLPIVTEVCDARDVEQVAQYADMLQIGARSMQNYPLLVEVGRTQKPVLLKRGLCATIDEWLMSAEYILSEGNPHVVLCERGVRGYDPSTRNVLDLGAVAAVRRRSPLPVIVDPSHATGRSALVAPMALAAIMAGCDGLMIEVHPDPERALSDAQQQLTPTQFTALMEQIAATTALRKHLGDAL